MLTPETLDALKQALSAVIDQAGDDPKYSGLVDALTQAQHALSHDGGHADAQDEPDDSFASAKERMIAARKAGAAE